MNPELIAVIPYIAVAFGLVASLTLFFSVKREMHNVARRERKHVDARVEAVAAQVRETPAPVAAEPVFVPVTIRPGLNINRRVHASRMLRRGDDVSTVAAALGVPRREVELLVRVQSLVTQNIATAGKIAAAAK